jgi:hypothetical protein
LNLFVRILDRIGVSSMLTASSTPLACPEPVEEPPGRPPSAPNSKVLNHDLRATPPLAILFSLPRTRGDTTFDEKRTTLLAVL